MKKKIAIVILAAGASRRLGQPKQLVKFRGEPLLPRIAEQCLEIHEDHTYVILGAKAVEIESSLRKLPKLKILQNVEWDRGMGNTIGFAARSILIPENYDGACFVLSDQIHFDSDLLLKLIAEHYSSEKPIILSQYQTGQGPPSFFDRKLFSELAQLDGDEGAKAIVQQYKPHVAYIDFAKGYIDIDTPDDLNQMEE